MSDSSFAALFFCFLFFALSNSPDSVFFFAWGVGGGGVEGIYLLAFPAFLPSSTYFLP